jgi:NDP-sugar pyrophosphorylase family protein
MKAVVLSAGRGKRLAPLTDSTPKALVRVGGKPLLEHVLLGLESAGFEEAMIVAGYLREQVESYFGAGAKVGLRLLWSKQEKLTGSADAALLARHWTGGEPFLLTFCDILTQWSNYGALRRAFEAHPSDALIGVNEADDPWAGAAVYMEGDRVIRLVEKPPPGTSSTRWNNAGAMILTPTVFDFLAFVPPADSQPGRAGERILPVAVAMMVEAGRDVRALKLSRFTSDVGTIEELQRIEELFAHGELQLSA